jgi:hypothetical protein
MALACLAVWFCCTNGYVLFYGDAQAHLNISRSIFDSVNPGYDQIGTVWLPVLHVLGLPLVGETALWSNGLAGAIPVAGCLVLAGSCLFLTARSVYADKVAAFVSLACFALNPNVLYLGSIPMTEIVFLAGLFVLLFAFCRYRVSRRRIWMAVAIGASWGMSLTRYDGWFLIPFAAFWFAAVSLPERRIRAFATFALLAGLAPIYWLGHCWWETGNALDFFNGPYSAKAIQAGKPYPGFHDWGAAFTYYGAAGRDCAGWPLILLGTLGGACAMAKEKYAVPLFLVLTPAFYVWSIHSSGTPVFVRELWPHGLYNTRYGIAVVALAAFLAGAIVLVLPARRRKLAIFVPLLAMTPWLFWPSLDNVICWKESQVNSEARRAWTNRAASLLRARYQRDTGVLASFGDLTGIFCRAGIPLRQVIHEGSGPIWDAMIKRPDLLHIPEWAIAQRGTLSDKALASAGSYRVQRVVAVRDAPPLDIYREIDKRQTANRK